MSSLNQSIGMNSGDVLSFTSSIHDQYYNHNVSVKELQSIINDVVLRPRFRVFILNQDETINRQIPPYDILEGGSYSENYQNGQRRSMSLTLSNISGQYTPNINGLWANVKMSLEMGLELNDNSTVWFKKGVYVVTNISPSQTSDNYTVSVELSDKFALFEGALGTLETSYEIPSGSTIEDVIRGIQLTSQGNGYALDPQSLRYHHSFKGKLTQAAISKSEGENYGAILIELATQLSAEVFYDAAGHLTFVPTQEVIGDNNKTVLADLHDVDGDYQGLGFTFDINSIVNRIVVIGSSVNGGVYTYTAVNNDPASPLSAKRIGYRTGSVINDSNITSDLLAQERAEYELRKQLILKSSSTIDISFNPLLSVNNLIRVYNEFYELTGERFIIQSISCPLGYSGAMSLGVSNLNNLPFVNG